MHIFGMWQHVIWLTGTHFKWTSCLHFQIPILFYPEDGGSKFFRNNGSYLSNYTVSHPTRQLSSHCPLYEPEISYVTQDFHEFTVPLLSGQSITGDIYLMGYSSLIVLKQFSEYSEQCNTILTHFLASWTLAMLIILANSWCY
jgi:hypothetical protein